MTNVLILGATGSIARVATQLFLDEPDVHLTRGQDVVYANLAGDLPRMARAIVTAMHASLVVKLATTPGLEIRRSLGISKPE